MSFFYFQLLFFVNFLSVEYEKKKAYQINERKENCNFIPNGIFLTYEIRLLEK
jgi:hypothetical protein